MIVAVARLTPNPSKPALSSHSFRCHVGARASLLLATAGPGEKYRDTKSDDGQWHNDCKEDEESQADLRHLPIRMRYAHIQHAKCVEIRIDVRQQKGDDRGSTKPCYLLMEFQQRVCLHYDKPIKDVRGRKPIEGHRRVVYFKFVSATAGGQCSRCRTENK
jgi:hypothetical protein